jgi:predicted trehalose synthase
MIHRIHGDLHLGQILIAKSDMVIVGRGDREDRPKPERQDTPLRDAGC